MKLSWKVLFLTLLTVSTLLSVLIGFFVATKFPNNDIIEFAFTIIVTFCTILSYTIRKFLFTFNRLALIFSGMFSGVLLNALLSTRFIAKPEVFSPIIFSEMIIIIVMGIKYSNLTIRNELALIFIGFSLGSLLSAGISFFQNLQAWYSLLPQLQEIQGAKIEVDASLIIDFLKSIFLSALFNVLEKVTKIPKSIKII